MDEKLWKKTITKIKKMFNTINKHTLTSPCGFQLLEHKGNKTIEVILSYRDVSGRFDAIKALNIATKDEFYVKDTPDNVKLYYLEPDSSCIVSTMIVSSKPIKEIASEIGNYNISETYICYPKVVLKLISDELWRNVDFSSIGTSDIKELIFDLDETVPYKYSLPFIKNTEKLNKLFQIKTFPSPITPIMNELINLRYNGSEATIIYENDNLTELLNENDERQYIQINISKDSSVRIYHADLVKINPKKLEIVKKKLEESLSKAIVELTGKDVFIVFSFHFIEV